MTKSTVLCLDIGSGTQDVLLHIPDIEPENRPKFVLPSPAKMVAKRIAALTAAGKNVYLYGSNMGGGFFGAVKKHLEAGLLICAHPDAAPAIHDNPERVRQMGVAVEAACPQGYVPVHQTDYDPSFWQSMLSTAVLEYPDMVMAAVQDHGYFPDSSNREGRFVLWRRFLAEHDGNPASLIFNDVPQELTRLAALQKAIGGGPVCDSGAAAVLGALSMPEIAQRSHRHGVTVVNVGNSHTVAFLVYRERVYGVYEHHTGMLDTDALLHDLMEFRRTWLPDEQVRASGGHGCMFNDVPEEAESFRPTFILGPRRAMLEGHGQFIAPGADMMLAGCFGMLYGLGL
ncbi:DUF1786 domain-containing protein [Oleidesulfovibrio sp.]|uniref:DUF1786 domain-containing protein n=1 Tax=Oleidesulfovibrio sp. TaxID=2909707 RepID=UPI003A888402